MMLTYDYKIISEYGLQNREVKKEEAMAVLKYLALLTFSEGSKAAKLTLMVPEAPQQPRKAPVT